MTVNYTDNIGADIYPEDFPKIINKYQNSGSFYININVQFQKNGLQIVTPMVKQMKNITVKTIFLENAFLGLGKLFNWNECWTFIARSSFNK